MPWYIPAVVEYTRTVLPFTSTVEPLVFALTAVPILNRFFPHARTSTLSRPLIARIFSQGT